MSPYKIDPKSTNAKTINRNYRKVLNALSAMSIKTQFPKILTVCLREDTFYGTMWVTNDNITIQQLPSDYCAISTIEGNVLNVSFDFSYFDSHSALLEFYPQEFKTKYAVYQKQRTSRWLELDSPTSFAIKVNNDILSYSLPPFIGILRELYDLEDYKQLKLTKTALENYAMLVMALPMDKDGNWGIDLNKAMEQLKEQKEKLPFDLCLALCCDEEFQHRGVDEFLNWKYRDKVVFAVVGEPTELRLACACKGSIRFCIETTGIAAHTSMPEKGENAIYLMAKIIQIFQNKIEKQTVCRCDSACKNATVAVSLIQGGTIVNSVPDYCIIHIDRRMIPGETWEVVYQEMQDMVCKELSDNEKMRVIFQKPYLTDPSYGTKLEEDKKQIVKEVLKKHGLHEQIKFSVIHLI